MIKSLTRFRTTLLVCAAITLQLRSAKAADDTTIQHVVAEGVGRTSEEAHADAWRNAVSQVVGAIVDTETLVKNDKLVSDTVLTYSRGYIERFKTLSQHETGALYRVRIEAWVKKTEVQEKLTAIQVLRVETDGGSIAAQIRTRQDQGKNASVLVAAALQPFLQAQHIKVAGLSQPQINVRADGAVLDYIATVAVDEQLFQQYSDALIEVLANVGTRLQLDIDTTVKDQSNAFVDVVRSMVDSPTGHPLDLRKIESATATDLGVIIQKGLEVVGFVLAPPLPRDWIMALTRPMGIKVRVRLLDTKNSIVAMSQWVCLPAPYASYEREYASGCTPWDGTRINEDRQIQGRIGMARISSDAPDGLRGSAERLFIGITNLVRLGFSDLVRLGVYSAREQRGLLGHTIPVKLSITLNAAQAKRVVRAEAQVAPYPDVSPK